LWKFFYLIGKVKKNSDPSPGMLLFIPILPL